MTSSSSSPPSSNGDEDSTDWAELPPDLTSLILTRLSNIDILENAQKVCRSWRRICKDPSMWRIICLRDRSRAVGYNYCDRMCRQAVDLSQGGLVEINLNYFGSDSLLTYIAHRSRNLRCLKFAMRNQITSNGLVNAVMKLPSLESLEISRYEFSNLDLKAIGNSCPNLKTLKLNRTFASFELNCDNEALAIAETMPGLRCLELFGSRLTNIGFNAVLEGCLHLEYIDIRSCLNIKFVRDVANRCFERNIKVRRCRFGNPVLFNTNREVVEEEDDSLYYNDNSYDQR